jgi:putative copper export protein
MYNLSITLHVLAATIWAGGHLILVIGFLPKALKDKDPEVIKFFESRYERIGLPALLILVITGFFQAFRMMPNFFDWFTFSYFIPVNVTIKLLLLLITLGLAIHAKTRVIPKLSKDNLKPLAYHIISITIVGILMVIVGVSFRYGGIF